MANGSEIANLKIGGRKLKPNEYVGSVEQILTNNLYSVLDKIGVSLADEFAKNVPVASGALASSISLLGVTEKRGTYSIEIYLGVEYHDYIDKGVKGIHNKARTIPNAEGRLYTFKKWGMPDSAIQSLKAWAKKKNIDYKGKQAAEGKRVSKKRLMKETDSAAKNLAYIIKRDGINARKYKDKSLKKVMPEYQKQLNEVGYNTLILKVIK
jgi:hypothetical protein